MTDEQKERSGRRPFGERDEEDEPRPFGSFPSRSKRGRTPPPESGDEQQPSDDPITSEDEPIQVPWVRRPAPQPEEDTEEEDAAFVEGSDEDLPYGDEPPGAPPMIRARDRRGKVSSGVSILKRIEAAPTEDEADEDEESTAGQRRELPVLRFAVLLRTIGVIGLIGAGVATVFTWWTPNTFLPTESMDQLSLALATQSGVEGLPPTPDATPIPAFTSTPLPLPANRIGIVSGHRGLNPTTGLPDPGAVCDDGLTEASINDAIASRVVEWLTEHGYEVDLFDEFDPRLQGYRAQAVVSIHADSCEYINEFATGFKVASFAESTSVEADARLVSCLIDHYSETTGLTFHPSVTYDMTQYHTFREVTPGVPGAIIEVGFMYNDRQFLTENEDVVALGVARGLLCFLRDEPVETVQPPTEETVITSTPLP